MAQHLSEAFEIQAGHCASLGSPFTDALLTLAATDIAAKGPTLSFLSDWGDKSLKELQDAAIALRYAGALHHIVLTHIYPPLTEAYPAASPVIDTEKLWQAVLGAYERHADIVSDYLARPVQTNEVRRSVALLGGFGEVLSHHNLPVRLLEIGASAGLNLYWDRFQYEVANDQWGNRESKVVLPAEWTGPAPALPDVPVITERLGCDINPMDVSDAATAGRLQSYVWPDQPDRLARLKAAIDIARAGEARLEKADAAEWVRQRLSEPKEGELTILFHTIMWQYMPAETQASVAAALDEAGAKATPSAPLAWLRLEPEEEFFVPTISLTLWPGGETRRLGQADPHGRFVKWGTPT